MVYLVSWSMTDIIIVYRVDKGGRLSRDDTIKIVPRLFIARVPATYN